LTYVLNTMKYAHLFDLGFYSFIVMSENSLHDRNMLHILTKLIQVVVVDGSSSVTNDMM
jgi:hypothetical protein